MALDVLVAEVVETLAPLAAQNENHLECTATGLGVVRQDAQRLRQVLINLGANACKFTRGGRITFSGRDDGDSVWLAVSDTGIGIAPEDLERLFEPFVQIDAGSNRRYGGTGLGLALARSFVERMGGTLTVDSVVGEGSSFHVGLPRVMPDHAPRVEAATPPGVPVVASASDTLLDD